MGFVLYRSSAGSGKTYTLVKEYLKIILQEPEKFKHILAITFTNKAAGEMKDRIMQSLKKLAKGEDPELEKTLKQEIPEVRNIDRISQDILTTLLHNYSDFAIMTIDSFIHKVIKAFALEIGLPLNFTIDLNYEKIQTYVIENLMADVGKDPYVTDIILEFVFSRVRQNKSWNIEGDIRKFEAELFNEKNFDWVKEVSTFDNVVFDRVTARLKSIRDDFIKRFNELGTTAMKLIGDAGLTIDDFAYKKSGAAAVFQKCANMGEKDLKTFDIGVRFRNGEWYSKGASAEIKAAIENLLENGLSQIGEDILSHFKHSRAQALTAVSVLDNIYLAAVINRLKTLVDEYKKLNNVIPISEFNIKVHEIVENSPVPFIYAIIGERYNHYLIDEFQDTSKLQWENLFPLIDNSLGSGFFSMAVGDGKQSIYRWRGGDVEIMETDIRKKILPEQLAVYPLDKNFRSRKNIVDFNNRFFQEISESYKEANPLMGQVYSDISQIPERKKGGFVSLQFIDEPSNEEEDLDVQVFDRVSDIIMHCRERDYEDSDIAILVRENRDGQKIAEDLLAKNIQVVSPDSLSLPKLPLIRFLIDVLTYLSNPGNKVAEASILYFMALNGKKQTAENEQTMTPSAVGDFIMGDKNWDRLPEQLKAFFKRREYLIRMPVYEVVEEVIRIFKLPGSLDFESKGYLQAFLNIVSRYTADNSVDISSFLDWWEFREEDFYMVVPETKPAVKIMSIHKAKGLEFPVVIIPYANWAHKMDQQLWLTSKPPLPTDPVLDFPMPVKSVKLLTETFFKEAYLEEEEKMTIDNINLLYVAFTRAVDNLYIIARRKKSKEKNVNYELLETRAAPMMREAPDNPGHFNFGELTVKGKDREKAGAPECESAEALISTNWTEKITIRRKSKEFWRFDTAYREERRNWGILVHQVLASIRTLDDVPRAVERTVISGDIKAAERESLEKEIREVFNIPQVNEWFDPVRAGRLFIESPIMTKAGVLIPDRVMISDGKVTVVDYKTGGKHPSHAEQLKGYKEALQNMGYEHVDAYLLYLESKEIKNV